MASYTLEEGSHKTLSLLLQNFSAYHDHNLYYTLALLSL